MHCVALGSANRMISGDVYGRAAQRIGEGTELLLTNGACGDLNPPAEGVPVEVVDDYARKLLRAISPPLKEGPGEDDRPLPASRIQEKLAGAGAAACGNPVQRPPRVLADYLCVESRSVWVDFEPFTESETRAYAVHALENEWARCEWPDKFPHAVEQWTENRLRELRESRQSKAAELDIQFIRLGETVWLTANAELFSQAVADLAGNGEPPIIACYANGLAGYLPPESAYEEGGYEVELACLFYDSLPFRRGAYWKLISAAAAGL